MAALPISLDSKFSKVFKMFCKTVFLITLVTSCQRTTAQEEGPLSTYDIFYSAGVEAYSQERWFECMSFMQKALADYKEYTDTLVECRLQCNSDNVIAENSGTLVELSFLESAIKKSDCLRRCKELRLKNRPESIDESVKADFDSLKPYDYLQICAYKVQDICRFSHSYCIQMTHFTQVLCSRMCQNVVKPVSGFLITDV